MIPAAISGRSERTAQGTRQDAIERFFDGLAATGHDERLAKASGTLRFDIMDGEQTERWRVAVNRGDLAVSRDDQPSDLIVHCRRPLFERVACGEANAMAALLRGELVVEGRNPELLVLFQRLLPRPRHARGDAGRIGRQ